VRGLEHGVVLAEVHAGGDPEAPDESRAEVGDDVPVEVRQHDHVEVVGVPHEPHSELVHLDRLEADVPVALRLGETRLEPYPVGELHDVRLVPEGDLAAAVLLRQLEGVLDDRPRRRHRDRLDGDPGVAGRRVAVHVLEVAAQLLELLRAALELDALVEVLGVLPHDDEVDVLET
jgi:hypothetical protein